MPETKIKSLIIDDDPFIRDLLADLIEQYIPEVSVMATASNAPEGIEMIEKYSPELIFLDVEMGDMTGFQLLESIVKRDFQTIFVTSHSHYAIQAIRFNALDYLLKPIDISALQASIKRYKDSDPRKKQIELDQALANMKIENISDQKLVLHTQSGELRIKLGNIIRIEGERNYSFIYLIGEKKKLVSKNLGELEELLSHKGFFRCHKSFLINRSHIQGHTAYSEIKLSDGICLPVSRRKKNAFSTWFNS